MHISGARSNYQCIITSLIAVLAFASAAQPTHAQTTQTTTSERIVVSGEELPSAYGAPPAFSRTRFSNLVNAYVLPPGGVFAGLIYEGDSLRFNRPDHMFTQEVEVGLPYRFGVAVENSIEGFRGTTQERTFSIEARYAFADWDKIPLNPTIFVEYKFGIGDILHDEARPNSSTKAKHMPFSTRICRCPMAMRFVCCSPRTSANAPSGR